jgi:antitoxin component YwqK of YwqJK toxin-antitoxin module
MKRLLLIVLPLLLIVGCSKEPINYETTLIQRKGVFYTKDTNKPYSGQVFSLYENGQKKKEGTYKDGKKDGVWTKWDKWGSVREEIWKDGEKVGLWTWWGNDDHTNFKEFTYYSNGKKERQQFYEDEKLSFTKEWYVNGMIKSQGIPKDGKVDGDGLWTYWYHNGQKKKEVTIKDGKWVSKKYWNEDGSVEE